MDRVVELAPAKINLTLHVLGRRLDGYHELSSVVAFADVGDRLSIAPADGNVMAVTGPFAAAVPTDESNSIWRAYHWLLQRMELPPVHVALEKNLPVASGIGGGSADAAAMLRGLLQLVGKSLDDAEVTLMAKELGADVPVCFQGRSCLMEGVGEKISVLTEQLPAALVLLNPMAPCSTAQVFKAMGLEAGKLRSVPATARWQNDMTVAAIQVQPKITQVLSALHKTDLFPVLMSGSGATCFGVARDFAEADRVAAEIANLHPQWWVKAARLLT